MKQKKEQIKKSETISNSLNSILAVFKNIITQMQALEETAYDGIRDEENKITAAQMEISAMQESLKQITSVKENIQNLLQPAE